MTRLPLSVVTIARNEAANILDCIKNTQSHVDEHIVLDMESDDGTPDLARSQGATVSSVPLIPNFDAARIPGIQAARNEWILVLDADERISERLWLRIEETIQGNSTELVMLPRANFAISGVALHESNWPEWQPRLFRRSAVDSESAWAGDLHSFLPFKDGIKTSRIEGVFPDQAMLHFTNLTVESFASKINQYTTREAAERSLPDFSSKSSVLRVLLRPFSRFLTHYVKRGGWKDGWRGFLLSGLFFFYEFLILAKQWERHIHGGAEVTPESARKFMRDSVPGTALPR